LLNGPIFAQGIFRGNKKIRGTNIFLDEGLLAREIEKPARRVSIGGLVAAVG
jgi:hypothetical protein